MWIKCNVKYLLKYFILGKLDNTYILNESDQMFAEYSMCAYLQMTKKKRVNP